MSSGERDVDGRLFDDWPEKYDRWFETPIGALVKKYENELFLDLLQPRPGESILDVGCGTGVFTLNILASGSRVTGLDISIPMLKRAEQKTAGYPFQKDDDPERATEIELDGQRKGLDTGAFLAARWQKPIS